MFIYKIHNYVFNMPTCTLLAPSSKIFSFFLSNIYDPLLHKMQSYDIVLNHFHLNLCKIIELGT